MERYDYRAALRSSILDYIEENAERYRGLSDEDRRDRLYGDLWLADSVTGNESGGYFNNAWKAEEALCHNFDILQDVISEFGISTARIFNAEYLDVSIRCYLLGEVLDDVLADMKAQLEIDE